MAAVSQKQYDVIMGLGNHHRTPGYWLERWLFLAGSIRSGKTYSSATGYVAWANNNFGGAQFIVAARLFRLIKANVRPQLERAATELRIPHRWRTADSVLEIGSNEHWCFDGGNEASADKIQGITASGGYLDEAALMPKRFVEAVGERCSEPGAKVIATLNPREPNHWIVTDYLEPAGYTVDGAGRIVVSGREADASRRVSGRHVGFSLADNPTLTAPYIQDLAATHSGTWLQRNVLGLWVAGEGLIWPRFTVCQAPEGPPDRWLVSIDAADRTVTHALLAGQWGPRIHIVDEWHHDAHRYGEIPVDEKVDAYIEHLTQRGHVAYWICDRFAYAELGVLRARNPGHIVDGPNTPGTKDVSIDQAYLWLQSGTCTIDESCHHLLASINGYTHESQRRRQQNSRKTDHGADALRNLLYDLNRNQGVNLAA
ncbi:MAG: hypothetical protein F4Y61_03290 [Rhodothermaceae bacterium]|nr:hypothetical protein [Rhodothermaceae bacterium]